MSDIKRFMVQDSCPCPNCDEIGGVYRTVEFDENGKSHTLFTDFTCMECGSVYKIIRKGSELFFIRSASIED